MNQKTIIYGKNPLKEAIKAKRKIEKVYLSSNDQSITNLLQKEKIKYVVINTKEMTNKFGPATQGVVAEVEPYRYQTLENVLAKTKDKLPFLVMLDGLEDPHNFGAIIRSAEAC